MNYNEVILDMFSRINEVILDMLSRITTLEREVEFLKNSKF